MHIRAGDTVVVLTGTDRNVRAKVLQVDRQTGKALVEGVARVYKHVRRSQQNPQGGRLSKEMPVQLSNLMLLCVSCGRGSRTGARFLPDGSKERYCKRCSTGLGQLAPAKAARAKG
jgi:large subunit ribosomal protein L24